MSLQRQISCFSPSDRLFPASISSAFKPPTLWSHSPIPASLITDSISQSSIISQRLRQRFSRTVPLQNPVYFNCTIGCSKLCKIRTWRGMALVKHNQTKLWNVMRDLWSFLWVKSILAIANLSYSVVRCREHHRCKSFHFLLDTSVKEPRGIVSKSEIWHKFN